MVRNILPLLLGAIAVAALVSYPLIAQAAGSYSIIPIATREALVSNGPEGAELSIPVYMYLPSGKQATLTAVGTLIDTQGESMPMQVIAEPVLAKGPGPALAEVKFEIPDYPAESFFDVFFSIEVEGEQKAQDMEHMVLINSGDHGIPFGFSGETDCTDAASGAECSGESKHTVFCECQASHWAGYYCRDIEGKECWRKDCIWEGPIISYSVQISESQANDIYALRDACRDNIPDSCKDFSGDTVGSCMSNAAADCLAHGASTAHTWDDGQKSMARVRGNSIWSGSG
jgi:hypothetical protein